MYSVWIVSVLIGELLAEVRPATFRSIALVCRFHAGAMLHTRLQGGGNMRASYASDCAQVSNMLSTKELVEACFLRT